MIRKVIVLTDTHVPYQDVKALSAVEKYMASERWDAYINLGDFLDMDVISSFNENKPRSLLNRYISADIAEANKVLDRHQSIIKANNRNAEFALLEGNHEERVERYLEAHPQFQGLLDVDVLLKLQERRFKWVRAWSKGEVYTYGEANFIHGHSTGKYHTSKMVEDFGENMFCGHTHDIQTFPKASKMHPGKVIVGQSLGCLCRLDMSYMQGRPSKWQQGFGVFYFKDDGTYTYYVPRIFNGEFVAPNGKLYKGL